MNEAYKKKAARINQIMQEVSALESELAMLFGENTSTETKPDKTVEKKNKVKSVYLKKGLGSQEKMKELIMRCVQKHGFVHPRFVYDELKKNGFRGLHIVACAQTMRHMKDAGKLLRTDTGLYCLPNNIGVSKIEGVMPKGFEKKSIG